MAEAEPKRDPGLFTVLARVRKPETWPRSGKRIEAALAEAAKTPIDAGAARRDQVAPALRVRRLARQRRRRRPGRRPVDRHHRPARRDERPLRRLRPPHPRRPPARRRAATSPRPTRRS